MTAAGATSATTIAIIGQAARCGIAAVAVAAATALVVLATGLDEAARGALRFGFAGIDHAPSAGAAIAVHNMAIAGGTLLCAAAAPRLPRSGVVCAHMLLGAVFALNATAIGLAFGAYGWRAIAATAPHLPLELAGLSLAGGAYLHACRHAVTALELVVAGLACAVLLAAAALIETYISGSGPR
jgi:hypothetical protein